MGFKLVVLTGPLAGQRFVLPPVLTTIGADPLSHITWTDERLALDHAEIRWEGGRHVLADLGSASGTFVNGRRIMSPRPLQPGDEIWIGECVFSYTTTPARPGEGMPPIGSDVAARPRRPLLAMLGVTLLAASVLVAFALVILPRLWETLLPATPAALPAALPSPQAASLLSVTPTPALPARTPEAQPKRYPVPALLGPEDGATGTHLTLQWSWPGALAADEWYAVRAWRQEETPQSLAWTKSPRYEAGSDLPPGVYRWQVVVVQGLAPGSWQRDLSAPSEIRRFTLLAPTAMPTLTPTATPTGTPTPTDTPTATPTPFPWTRVLVSGKAYNAAQGIAATLADVEVRAHLAGQRLVAHSDGAGIYRLEFRLRGALGETRLDLVAMAAGFDPGLDYAVLGPLALGATQQVYRDLGLFPAFTPTATWIRPTTTASPSATRTP